MSFILDALKKSESDRLKRDVPGFAHVPDKSQEKSTSHWIWIVVVLIVINVFVLTMMYLKPDRAPPVAATRPPAESIAIAPTVTMPSSVPEPVADTPQPADSLPDAAISPSPAPLVRQPATSAAPTVASPGSSGSGEVTESYATFNDLRVQGILNLPDLHLDIHVFSEQAENRFVFVNMSKYKEGATLDEGPAVAEILPEGVILKHRGITFLLPRE
jgi:general secretion pathway protein B